MSKTVGASPSPMGKRAATGGYDASGIDADAWEVLEGQLEATIPNYDRVNTWMTFGQDKRWRRNVRNHAQPGMNVLEVGCGPGSFAEDLVGMELTCLDPSPEMLATAQPRVDTARAARGAAIPRSRGVRRLRTWRQADGPCVTYARESSHDGGRP